MKNYNHNKIHNNSIRSTMKGKGYIQTFVWIPKNRKADIQTVAKHYRDKQKLHILLSLPFLKTYKRFTLLWIDVLLMPRIK